MSDCVFCRIIAGAIPSKPLFEDEDCIAIHDISPMAPLHILIIPKAHIASLDELEDGEIAAACLNACKKAAAMLNLDSGYRVVTNIGSHGGQSVAHLHFHVLGGRQLGGFA